MSSEDNPGHTNPIAFFVDDPCTHALCRRPRLVGELGLLSLSIMGDDDQDDLNTTKKTKKKSKKKQRKRSNRSRMRISSTETATPTMGKVTTTARDNRKRSAPLSSPDRSPELNISKKKQKTPHRSGDVSDSNDPDVPLLEGAMVNNHDGQQQMVLVDKRNGMVYSTIQPLLTDGSRPQIGTWNNGQIQLFPMSANETETHLGKYTSPHVVAVWKFVA